MLEARQRSPHGEPTVVGARVEAQLRHDRYRVRNLLNPQPPRKNERYEPGGAKITIPANYPTAVTISQMDLFWNGVGAGALTTGAFFLIAALLIWARVRNG